VVGPSREHQPGLDQVRPVDLTHKVEFDAVLGVFLFGVFAHQRGQIEIPGFVLSHGFGGRGHVGRIAVEFVVEKFQIVIRVFAQGVRDGQDLELPRQGVRARSGKVFRKEDVLGIVARGSLKPIRPLVHA